MAAGKCLYLEQKILDFMLGRTPYAPPTDFYIALSSLAFSRNTTGASILSSEPSGGGYDRAHIVNDSSVWDLADGTGQKSNLVSLPFPAVTSSWGPIRSFYLLDGNARSLTDNACYGSDLPLQTIDVGPGPIFPAGALVLREV